MWYFETAEVTQRSLTALKWTLTTQFGSLCFGSFILSVVHAINQAVQAMRDGARRGEFVGQLLCALNPALAREAAAGEGARM